jgi:hypothetical protein
MGADDRKLKDGNVAVRRSWNDYRIATYRLADLSGVHWGWFSGGVQAPAPQPFFYAYVQCDGMLQGELAHSRAHGRCPHSIRVCITKKGNDPAVYAGLLTMAGRRPQPAKRAPDIPRSGKLSNSQPRSELPLSRKMGT